MYGKMQESEFSKKKNLPEIYLRGCFPKAQSGSSVLHPELSALTTVADKLILVELGGEQRSLFCFVHNQTLTLLKHCSSSLLTLCVSSNTCFVLLFSTVEEYNADILISMVVPLLLLGRLRQFSNTLNSFLNHSFFFSDSFWTSIIC